MIDRIVEVSERGFDLGESMIFDQYIKLFDLKWLEPWIVEALVIVAAALLLSWILCKTADCMNGENK